MNSALVYSLFVGLYLLLIWKAGKTFPILHLFLLTYFIQYIFSTYLIYNEYGLLERQMPIDQVRYFDYALPAIFCLFAGVLTFHKDFDLKNLIARINPQRAAIFGSVLLGISYFFDLALLLGITSVASIVSFTKYLKYAAAFCFLFSSFRFKYIVIALIYLQLVNSVLRSGVFVDFFIWSTYLFFFVCLKFKIPFWLRLSFIFVAVPILVTVQGVKEQYRQATWRNQQEGGLGLITELAEKNQDELVPFEESEGVVSTVGRLTQGWHLASTLKWVPERIPFEQGQEILSDITSSVLPRILFADKKIVGAQDKFHKYTGRKLERGTSMTIGVLGDFYVNFGYVGSFFMLFVFGALLAIMLRKFIRRYVLLDPINIIWIPFLLNYLVRANNDFYMVFNNLVKGFLIFLLVQFIIRKFWPESHPVILPR
jgi:hypothetical protein